MGSKLLNREGKGLKKCIKCYTQSNNFNTRNKKNQKTQVLDATHW